VSEVSGLDQPNCFSKPMLYLSRMGKPQQSLAALTRAKGKYDPYRWKADTQTA
jgi:hypothetical protein